MTQTRSQRPERPQTTKANEAEKLTQSAAQATLTMAGSPCNTGRRSVDNSRDLILKYPDAGNYLKTPGT